MKLLQDTVYLYKGREDEEGWTTYKIGHGYALTISLIKLNNSLSFLNHTSFSFHDDNLLRFFLLTT